LLIIGGQTAKPFRQTLVATERFAFVDWPETGFWEVGAALQANAFYST
jgi:hypothetical protein